VQDYKDAVIIRMFAVCECRIVFPLVSYCTCIFKAKLKLLWWCSTGPTTVPCIPIQLAIYTFSYIRWLVFILGPVHIDTLKDLKTIKSMSAYFT